MYWFIQSLFVCFGYYVFIVCLFVCLFCFCLFVCLGFVCNGVSFSSVPSFLTSPYYSFFYFVHISFVRFLFYFVLSWYLLGYLSCTVMKWFGPSSKGQRPSGNYSSPGWSRKTRRWTKSKRNRYKHQSCELISHNQTAWAAKLVQPHPLFTSGF